MSAGLQWGVPSPYRRTVCVNHTKLESVGGGENDTSRKHIYPVLNVGGDVVREGGVEESDGQELEDTERQGWSIVGLIRVVYSSFWKWVLRMPTKTCGDPELCGRALMDWHPRLSTLATVAGGQILIYPEKNLREGRRPHEVARPMSPCKYFCVSYRPNSPGDITGGSDNGLHLYTRSLPQLAEGSLAHERSCYRLKKLGQGHIDCVAWHPAGNIVAAAGASRSGFTVWDANLETGVRMAVLWERVNLLRWSPCGSYIASASQDGMFYLWEARNWSMRSWTCGKWGNVVTAEWDPRSRFIVLAFGKVHKLIIVHITQDPPALETSWVGLDMDQLSPAPSDNVQDGMSENDGCIDWMAWNKDGSRMAVALKDPHPADGCIALFHTAMSGSPNAVFIGYARPFQKPATGPYRVGPTYMQFHKRSATEDILAVQQGRLVSFLDVVRKQK